MARSYYQFSKKQFEYELKGISLRNNMRSMVNITEEYRAEGKVTWEHVYKIPTRNKSVEIIIFSSVDITLNAVRENGADAVRVVLKWVTKKGPMYKAIHTHYRIKTLFSNLENTLIQAQGEAFNLVYNEFTEAK